MLISQEWRRVLTGFEGMRLTDIHQQRLKQGQIDSTTNMETPPHVRLPKPIAWIAAELDYVATLAPHVP